VKEALARTVGLDPFAVEYELRDRSLAHIPDDLIRGARAGLDIDFGEGNLVLLQEPFGFAAISAPGSGIDQHMHLLIISTAVF
jgi:hypothetical protein